MPFTPDAFVASDRLGAALGARFVSLAGEVCVYEYEASEGHLNAGGTLHGGALFTVMDSSQGMLVFSLIAPPFSAAATGTATIKYLAPVRQGRITITTRVDRREGRKLFVHSDAASESGALVAVLDAIWIVMPSPTPGAPTTRRA